MQFLFATHVKKINRIGLANNGRNGVYPSDWASRDACMAGCLIGCSIETGESQNLASGGSRNILYTKTIDTL